MKVADLIQREVLSVRPDATCVEAARIMRDERVGSVVVVDNGQPLGIVTDRDLVIRSMASGGDPETVRILTLGLNFGRWRRSMRRRIHRQSS